ncbi:hypothetical protein BH11PLA1_BH11PLA1_18280 [soil metagenome]
MARFADGYNVLMNSPRRFKPIHYRGSLVHFEIPEDWMEEYEPDGGGTFYPPIDESVTLRLSILTLEAPANPEFAGLERVFGAREFRGLPIEKLANGQAMCIGRVIKAEERGQPLDLHRWGVARSIPPRCVRLALFTTTIAVGVAAADQTRATLDMLLVQVRKCRIADAAVTSAPRP